MIADHDRDRQSRDFQNMIVSDRRSWFGKMIVSDRRSQKKVSCLTLSIVQSNLDVVNKIIRPCLFTISNNSLYQM